MDFNDLVETRKNRVLVASHRGVSSANIPCNSIASFKLALNEGADIVELDVTKSLDGELFTFHPFMDLPHLKKIIPLQLRLSSNIQKLRYVNCDLTKTTYGIPTLDDALDFLKGKSVINIDKFWSNPKLILEKLDRHDMRSQVIIKSYYSPKKIKIISELAHDVPYMLMTRKIEEGLERAIKDAGVNLVAEEIIFDSLNSDLISDRHILDLHNNSIYAWVNTIVYNYKDVISGGLTDDRAILGEQDAVWGYLIDRGIDVIQTDWVRYLRDYLKK